MHARHTIEVVEGRSRREGTRHPDRTNCSPATDHRLDLVV